MNRYNIGLVYPFMEKLRGGQEPDSSGEQNLVAKLINLYLDSRKVPVEGLMSIYKVTLESGYKSTIERSHFDTVFKTRLADENGITPENGSFFVDLLISDKEWRMDIDRRNKPDEVTRYHIFYFDAEGSIRKVTVKMSKSDKKPTQSFEPVIEDDIKTINYYLDHYAEVLAKVLGNPENYRVNQKPEVEWQL